MIGTVGYMSPEQVRGGEVDARADVFTFGCLLFEALSGRHPFAGTTAVDTLHQIAHGRAAPIAEVSPEVPADLAAIVARCLVPEPEGRYPTCREVAADLHHAWRRVEASASVASALQMPPGPAIAAPRKPGGRRALLAAALGVAAAGLALAAFLRGGAEDRVAPAPGSRLRIERLTYSGRASMPTVSRDGKVVAHVVTEAGRSSLWVRQVATASSLRIVAPAEAVYSGVTLTPDGNYAYYVLRRGHALVRTLHRVPLLGGMSRKVLDDVDSPVTFSPDGRRFAFVRMDPIARECHVLVAPTAGGEPRRVATRPFPTRLAFPAWSPDGNRIAVVGRVGETARFGVFEVAADGGAPRQLTRNTWSGFAGLAWLPDGSALVAAAADRASRMRQLWLIAYPSGDARRITNDPNDYQGVSLRGDGGAIVSTQVDRLTNLWIAGAAGDAPPRQLFTGAGRHHSLAAAPDGRIVYAALEGDAWDLWIAGPDGDRPRRLTSDAGANVDPAISPDGRTIAFVSDRGGSPAIWRMNIDGGDQRRLTPGHGDVLPSFAPDGKWVIYTSYLGAKQTVWKVPAEGGEPVAIVTHYALGAIVSPDGARLAMGYWDEKPDSPWRIGVFPASGGQPERLFDLPGTASLLVRWTPDGTGLSYVDHRDGTSNVWIQPLAGPPRKVTDFNSDLIFHHAWLRGGRELVLVRGMQTSDIVMLRDFR
jgi:Tol biopolymer transport system component